LYEAKNRDGSNSVDASAAMKLLITKNDDVKDDEFVASVVG
jgi:hypothetical protein